MSLNVHHRRAAQVMAATAVLDTALGVGYGFADHIGFWHGVYCSTATAETVGCDVAPHGWLAYLLAFAMLMSIVVLFPVVFAYFTTGLTADHVDARHEQLKDHVSQAYEAHEQPPGTAPTQPPGPGGGGGTEVDGPRAAPPP